MICVFVDETSDEKFKDYFGICCAAIKHNFYPQIKTGFQRILLAGGWDPAIEFKGAYLFSATKGCIEVPIDKRVEMAEAVIDLNTASKNARMRFAYFRKSTTTPKQDYLEYLPALLYKVLSRYGRETGQGKNLVSVHCDFRSDITAQELQSVVLPVLERKGFVLFEDVKLVRSNFDTVGILYADIVGYLMARVETIANDSELFESIPPEMFERNGKIKKLKSSLRIVNKIKALDVFGVRTPIIREAGYR